MATLPLMGRLTVDLGDMQRRIQELSAQAERAMEAAIAEGAEVRRDLARRAQDREARQAQIAAEAFLTRREIRDELRRHPLRRGTITGVAPSHIIIDDPLVEVTMHAGETAVRLVDAVTPDPPVVRRLISFD